MGSLKTKTKDPDERLDYTFDYSEQLARDGNDTIAQQATTVPAGLTHAPGEDVETDTFVKVWLSGGVANQDYEVTNHMTTVGGRVYDRSFTLRVRNL